MGTNAYHFVSHWRVEGSVQEVSAIIEDAACLTQWWPSVYLDLTIEEPGDEHGVGKVVALYTKGWLPYTLRWRLRVTESRSPFGLSVEAWGDFVGQGVWTFAQSAQHVDITYDWRIVADKPLLRSLSFLLRPIFAANHRWAMAQGETSLRLELARRRAGSAEERAGVPLPPGPTFPHRRKMTGRVL